MYLGFTIVDIWKIFELNRVRYLNNISVNNIGRIRVFIGILLINVVDDLYEKKKERLIIAPTFIVQNMTKIREFALTATSKLENFYMFCRNLTKKTSIKTKVYSRVVFYWEFF